MNKYSEILSAEGVSCVELWKSFYTPDIEMETIKGRMSQYSKDDWEAMKMESCEVIYKFLSAYRSNLSYDSPEAMEAAEAHKTLVDKWFLPNTYGREMWMAHMAKLTEISGTFGSKKGFYDKFQDGLGEYVYKAVINNAKIRMAIEPIS